ncbi:hypothetical protein MKX03_034988 [Papaver bracteatum]|nr:hypothetical protein MKX03_034988 [Papaver bracteatum]
MSKQRQSKISFGGSKLLVDPTWEHCKVVTGGKKTALTCNYCGNKYSGGVYRMNQNLVQTKKDDVMFKEVPPEVKQFFLSHIKKFENDKEKCEELGDLNGEDDLGTRENLMRNALDETKIPNTLSTYFKKPKREDACMAICDFFYANTLPFNLIKHTNGKDLIRAGATRFATYYLNLKSFHVFKVALIKMFTLDAWTKRKHAKEQHGIKVQKIILSDENFWQSVISFLKSVIPIVEVLRLVDGDDKPEMGYIYKAIDKEKEQIQANFKNKKRRYESYINIIDLIWNTQLHGPLHAAGYFLNPRYQYATDFAPNVDVKLRFYDAIKRMCPSVAQRRKIDKQIDLFTSFGGYLWWKSYGDFAPEIQRVFIRILSATCSASGRERNWSIFEKVDTKKSNRLSQQRLNALVYVKYNLQLEEMFTKRNEQGDSYDLICLSDMESDDEWITEKDGASLQPDPTWMDKRKIGPRNLSTIKLAQSKGNNNGKEARLVEENEIEEVEDDEIKEETYVEEMSETEIQAESDNEWLFDNGFDMGDH